MLCVVIIFFWVLDIRRGKEFWILGSFDLCLLFYKGFYLKLDGSENFIEFIWFFGIYCRCIC